MWIGTQWAAEYASAAGSLPFKQADELTCSNPPSPNTSSSTPSQIGLKCESIMSESNIWMRSSWKSRICLPKQWHVAYTCNSCLGLGTSLNRLTRLDGWCENPWIHQFINGSLLQSLFNQGISQDRWKELQKMKIVRHTKQGPIFFLPVIAPL